MIAHNTPSVKMCEVCGATIHKPEHTSWEQWELRRFCSKACMGIGRKGERRRAWHYAQRDVGELPPPGHEDRIAMYEQLAAQGRPLFPQRRPSMQHEAQSSI